VVKCRIEKSPQGKIFITAGERSVACGKTKLAAEIKKGERRKLDIPFF